MKKVFKIGWIVLILGVIMLGIGYFNNGDKAVYFENNRPAILHSSTKKISTNKHFERIDITASTANVVIREGKKYQVTYSGISNHAPAVSVHNNVASIRQTGDFPFMVNINHYGFHQDLITVTVPHDQALAGRIHLESGDLSVSNAKLDNVDVDVDSGNVEYHQVTLRGGNTKIESGNFTGRNLTVQGHYTVNNQSGDNTVTNTTVDGYFLKTDAGDNELNGEDKGEETLHQNDNAESVLRLLTQSGDNEVN
ncbi:DUF4097 family beta strand repeat protein [Lactobacillus sp. Marseille-P7033]|nr:DUF4097 family beta strand repeat protein [Lactobacillus sp. Marseille-P7033]NGC78819.1 DUF4097 family beta strand repeat protein [Limosilactobacillus reuteri]